MGKDGKEYWIDTRDNGKYYEYIVKGFLAMYLA